MQSPKPCSMKGVGISHLRRKTTQLFTEMRSHNSTKCIWFWSNFIWSLTIAWKIFNCTGVRQFDNRLCVILCACILVCVQHDALDLHIIRNYSLHTNKHSGFGKFNYVFDFQAMPIYHFNWSRTAEKRSKNRMDSHQYRVARCRNDSLPPRTTKNILYFAGKTSENNKRSKRALMCTRSHIDHPKGHSVLT